MEQGKKGEKKLSRSTITFKGDASDPGFETDVQNAIAAAKATAAAIALPPVVESAEDKPLNKTGMRRRAPMRPSRLLERVGPYVVEQRLATTASADIYRCTHALTQAVVIAKVHRLSEAASELDSFNSFCASVEQGDVPDLIFVARGECPTGPYLLVEAGSENTAARLAKN